MQHPGDEYTVVLFHSANHAIHAEKVLADVGVVCKLIPVPRHLSSDCGFCVRLRRVERDAAVAALAKARVDIAGAYDL